MSVKVALNNEVLIYTKFPLTDESKLIQADVCFSSLVCGSQIGEEVGNGEQGGLSLTGERQTLKMV